MRSHHTPLFYRKCSLKFSFFHQNAVCIHFFVSDVQRAILLIKETDETFRSTEHEGRGRAGPDFFCVVTKGAAWRCFRGDLSWTLGKGSFSREWLGTGTGCPGKWSQHQPWQSSRSIKVVRSWARWPLQMPPKSWYSMIPWVYEHERINITILKSWFFFFSFIVFLWEQDCCIFTTCLANGTQFFSRIINLSH